MDAGWYQIDALMGGRGRFISEKSPMPNLCTFDSGLVGMSGVVHEHGNCDPPPAEKVSWNSSDRSWTLTFLIIPSGEEKRAFAAYYAGWWNVDTWKHYI